MHPDILLRLVHRRPFRPFRLYIHENTWFPVTHPDALMVGEFSALLILPILGGFPEGFEQQIVLDLAAISRTEGLGQIPSLGEDIPDSGDTSEPPRDPS